MNLFVTDHDPFVCARSLDDKRVGKLLMEANQMLSMAVKRHHSIEQSDVGPGKLVDGHGYDRHPVTLWVGDSISNFDWTYRHAVALAIEFRHRFGKSHSSAARTPYIFAFRDCLPPGPLLPFQNSAKNGVFDFTYLPPPASYRHYLMCRWRHDKNSVKFTNREPPEWSRRN